MQNNKRINESGGMFMKIVSFIFTPIAGLFLYIILFVLTAIGVYYTKKIEHKDVIYHHNGTNLIYLNSASKHWHNSRGRI